MWTSSGKATLLPGHRSCLIQMCLSLQKKSSCVSGRVGLRPWLSESNISYQPPPGGSSSFLFKLRERVLNLPSSLPHLRFPLPSFPLPSPLFPLFPDFTHVCWVYFCLSFSLSLSTEVCVCLIIGRRDLFFFSFAFCFLSDEQLALDQRQALWFSGCPRRAVQLAAIPAAW